MPTLYGSDVVTVHYGEQVLSFDPVEHTYHLGSQPLKSVTQYLKEAGYIHPWHGNGEAATFGRYVHEATAYDDLGDLDMDNLNERIAARVAAWRAFKKAEDFVPALELMERPCFHPIYLWAGTPDVPGAWHSGKPCVVEKKSGVKERWHEVQNKGGYVPMLAAHYPQFEKAESPIVYLNEDGLYKPGRDLVVPTEKHLPALFASIVATINGKALYGDNNGRT